MQSCRKMSVGFSVASMQLLVMTLSHSSDLQVALHFVELDFDEEQKRVFDVKISVNGQMSTVLSQFDIYGETGEMPSKASGVQQQREGCHSSLVPVELFPR